MDEIKDFALWCVKQVVELAATTVWVFWNLLPVILVVWLSYKLLF